jgi:hypothetical protein
MAANIAILQPTNQHCINCGARDDPELADSRDSLGEPPIRNGDTHTALNDRGK